MSWDFDDTDEVDETDDSEYFEFIFKLEEENESRYQAQARELVKSKTLITELNGILIRYKLSFRYFLCEISFDGGENYHSKSLARMRWRKAEKLEALPLLFADTEASLLREN